MVPEIDQDSIAASLGQDGTLVVDVREVQEYHRGHVPGARNVPLSVLPVSLTDLPKDRPVYVICQSGRRSARATALLRSVGIDAANVAGGTGAWIASGRPVRAVAA